MFNNEESDIVNQQASILMKCGIALLEKNTPDNLKEAIFNFDEAIALRKNLPLDVNPLFRYGLAAGWMNRGDALTRLGSAEHLSEALRSYDTALKVLQGLSLDANPLFRRRLAICWSNRGLTLQKQNNASAILDAGRSFEEAIAALLNGNAAAILDRDYLLATALMNYANVLVNSTSIESITQARMKAKRVMVLADQTSSQDLATAELSLKSRHILCQAISKLLIKINQTDLVKKELIDEATDAVDDGMALARSWEKRGVMRFLPLTEDLFHFGARAYQTFQPHFLNEFLLENPTQIF